MFFKNCNKVSEPLRPLKKHKPAVFRLPSGKKSRPRKEPPDSLQLAHLPLATSVEDGTSSFFMFPPPNCYSPHLFSSYLPPLEDAPFNSETITSCSTNIVKPKKIKTKGNGVKSRNKAEKKNKVMSRFSESTASFEFQLKSKKQKSKKRIDDLETKMKPQSSLDSVNIYFVCYLFNISRVADYFCPPGSNWSTAGNGIRAGPQSRRCTSSSFLPSFSRLRREIWTFCGGNLQGNCSILPFDIAGWL